MELDWATLVKLGTVTKELLALLIVLKFVLFEFQLEVKLLRLHQIVLCLGVRHQTKPCTLDNALLWLRRHEFLGEVDDSVVGDKFVLHGGVLDKLFDLSLLLCLFSVLTNLAAKTNFLSLFRHLVDVFYGKLQQGLSYLVHIVTL